jgi:hypothetical protein
MQTVKHIERTGLICSVASTGLCAAGLRYISGQKAYDESDPIAITSVFRERMGKVCLCVGFQCCCFWNSCCRLQTARPRMKGYPMCLRVHASVTFTVVHHEGRTRLSALVSPFAPLFTCCALQLRDGCKSSTGSAGVADILDGLEDSWDCLLDYMAFTDLRQCCICRFVGWGGGCILTVPVPFCVRHARCLACCHACVCFGC